MSAPTRNYPDLHDHLDALRAKNLLITVDEKIDKDAELHPLVRWAFVGGMKEEERKAFLFTNIVDGKGRKYKMPVVVGAIAANRAIYSIGMGAPVEEIDRKWERAIANPVEPRIVNDAPCHEVVIEGKELEGEGHGLDALPINKIRDFENGLLNLLRSKNPEILEDIRKTNDLSADTEKKLKGVVDAYAKSFA